MIKYTLRARTLCTKFGSSVCFTEEMIKQCAFSCLVNSHIQALVNSTVYAANEKGEEIISLRLEREEVDYPVIEETQEES